MTTKHTFFKGDEAAYGLWVKDRKNFEYFSNAFTNNKMTFKTDLSFNYTSKDDIMNARDSDSMLRLSADVTHYYYLYAVLGALIVAMLLFGAVL